MRNKLAHNITFDPTISELRSLWGLAQAAFNDLTDGIEQGLGKLRAVTRVEDAEDWVYGELFVQICYDLHSEFVDRGGDLEDF